jgi:methyltransferase (TIGR00027 family)
VPARNRTKPALAEKAWHMAQAAAKTGSGPTAMVAVEQYFPLEQRILIDDLSISILPLGAKVLLWFISPSWARNWLIRFAEKNSPGLWALVMCRKRFIDDKLIESVDCIGAIVNLGAGSDTRVYRLQALAHIPAWEIDQQQNIDAKRARLQKMFRAVPSNVTLIAADFDHDELGATLKAGGVSNAVPTFFILEGVLQYLTEPAVKSIFDFMAKAAKGSRLAFTYVRKDFIDGRSLYGQEGLHQRYVQKGIWIVGLEYPDGVANLLSEYGWRLIEDFGYEELAQRYVKPSGRELSSTPVERVAYAEKL